MARAVVMACLPWLGCLLAAWAVGLLLMRLGGCRFRARRLLCLHRDQSGAVQSLSFVLTLPLFVMVMLFIVQVSQLMIGTIVVNYAAFAAARAAIVWIPADMPPEGPNCIAAYAFDPQAPDQVFPVLDPDDPRYGPAEGGVWYVISPDSAKYRRIRAAAVLAVLPVCPSRDLGGDVSGQAGAVLDVLQRAYAAMAPKSAANPRVDRRLENKLAYAMAHTRLEMRFFHKNSEPPLVTYFLGPDFGEFYFNELGWQDPITVTVHHDLALLPGPGRLLAKSTPGPSGTDEVGSRITRSGRTYTYPLSASAVLGNEGEKPVVRFPYDAGRFGAFCPQPAAHAQSTGYAQPNVNGSAW